MSIEQGERHQTSFLGWFFVLFIIIVFFCVVDNFRVGVAEGHSSYDYSEHHHHDKFTHTAYTFVRVQSYHQQQKTVSVKFECCDIERVIKYLF